jgi:sugar lactone lactonase YvrE
MSCPLSRRCFAAVALLGLTRVLPAAEPVPANWLYATAYAVPKETTNEGEGYFSIVPGHNGRLYIGTAKHGVGSYLVEFDPKMKQMKVVVDAQKEIGTSATGFAAQAKIHTRNNVGASGKIYFGTKQGHRGKDEKPTDYPGGYPMVYDPETGTARVYPIPVPHQGIISITPEEARGVAYISTCADTQPDSTHFLILDLKTGKYRDLMDCQHMFAFIVVDCRGRAYHPILGGDIACYDPDTDKLMRLKQTIDGKPPTPESRLALPETHPINWDIAPDGKTLYALPMSTNELYSYDLTAAGDTLPGRSLGTLVPGAKTTDCRAMCVGPTGDVWAAVTVPEAGVSNLMHLVTYRPGDKAPQDLGPVAVKNPGFTEFTDKDGKPLPFHHGFHKLADGTTVTQYVILGSAQGQDGAVYSLALSPYTVLQVQPPARK